MIPVMIFVDGPADGWMLSSNKQVYAVGLEPPVDGKALCALYYRFGTSPGFAGDLPTYMTGGCCLYKGDKVRPLSLIDGWLPKMEPRNAPVKLEVDPYEEKGPT